MLGLEEKLGALATLGLSPKKIELYKLKLQNPDKTQQELGEMVGKPRRTVIRWLQDVEALAPKPI
jgi:predicted transcriptional regulator